MTEEKMMELCKEIVPAIEKIREAFIRHGIEKSVHLNINNSDDCQVTMIGWRKDFDGWDLTKFKNKPYEIWQKGEPVQVDKE